jgi:ABC-type polysaccharide/polyol phosphate export permease
MGRQNQNYAIVFFLDPVLRDIPQTVTIAVNLLFYLTPISDQAVPEMFRPIMKWNPG